MQEIWYLTTFRQEMMVIESHHKKNADKLAGFEREIRDFSLVKDQILKEKEYKEFEYQTEITKLKVSLEMKVTSKF